MGEHLLALSAVVLAPLHQARARSTRGYGLGPRAQQHEYQESQELGDERCASGGVQDHLSSAFITFLGVLSLASSTVRMGCT